MFWQRIITQLSERRNKQHRSILTIFGHIGRERGPDASDLGLVVLVLGILACRDLLGDGHRALKEQRHDERGRQRVVEQVGHAEATGGARLRREREAVDGPPQDHVADVVGMTRVGEEAFAVEAATKVLDLLVAELAAFGISVAGCSLFAEPLVLARLKAPLLLVGEHLESQAQQKDARHQPVERVHGLLQLSAAWRHLVRLNEPERQRVAEQDPVLHEAHEHEVEDVQLQLAREALLHKLPAVVFVSWLVVSASPKHYIYIHIIYMHVIKPHGLVIRTSSVCTYRMLSERPK